MIFLKNTPLGKGNRISTNLVRETRLVLVGVEEAACACMHVLDANRVSVPRLVLIGFRKH
jgi:hypothetical protein